MLLSVASAVMVCFMDLSRVKLWECQFMLGTSVEHSEGV